ncbi:MAG: bile acid:sodium symporter [Myxococcales bacterium]|nr:bile acid:sodium symporter [Myxococcales bacterium]MDD9971153.1 bile acid:sodium symporter [Myxococcales bacterium]
MQTIFSVIPTATLFAMMVAMGMTLRLDDFRRLALQPTPIGFGLLGQLVMLPLAAFAIAALLALPQNHAVGLVLIAACPGGITSNALAHYARGDTALSISLTALSSLVSFVTVPFVVSLGIRLSEQASSVVELPHTEMVLKLLLTTALPVFLGMAALHYGPGLVARLQRPLLLSATGVLILLVVGLGVSVSSRKEDIAGLWRTVPAVVLLIGSMMGVGMLGARALRLNAAQGRTIAIELGIQNFNLALVVAVSVLDRPRYVGPALVYMPVMLLFAGGLIAAVRRAGPVAAAVSSTSASPIVKIHNGGR